MTATVNDVATAGGVQSLWRRQIYHYPDTRNRMWYLAIVVAATIMLYYELYIAGAVSPSIIAGYGMTFPFYVYISVVGNAVGAFGSPCSDYGYGESCGDEEFSDADSEFPGHLIWLSGTLLALLASIVGLRCCLQRTQTGVSVLLRSQVVSFAGQDLGWIRGVCSAVPGQEAAHGIAWHGVEFFAQDFAADS